MDPKNFPSNLDPKLKETYERVMGMSLGNAAPAAPPAGGAQPPTGTTQVLPHAEDVKPGVPPTPAQSGPAAVPPGTGLPLLPNNQPFIPSMPAMPTSVGPQMPPPAALPPLPGLSPLKSPIVSPSTMPDTSTPPVVTPEEHNEPTKKGSIIKILLFTLGGIVFILVYIVVWVKVFNLTLPFQLPF